MKIKYSYKGFTLAELMIAVLIIGVLGAVAIPNFLTATEKTKSSEAVQILGELHKAQEAYFIEHGVYAPNLDSLEVIYAATDNFRIPKAKPSGRVLMKSKSGGRYKLKINTQGVIKCKDNNIAGMCASLGYPADDEAEDYDDP